MGLIADKARGHAGMALAAGGLQIRFGHGRFRIRRRQDRMLAVAVPTTRGRYVPESGHLGMECIAIVLYLLLVALPASRRGFHLPSRRANIGDLVRGMAIRANRCARISHLSSLPMNARHVIPLGACMAGSTRGCDVGAVGAAQRIRLAENLVRSVTAHATGSYQEPLFS